MTLEVEISCPLGHKCESVDDGKIVRCAWYVEIHGKNPQTGDEMKKFDCAIAWGPLIAIEGNGMNRAMVASFQSMRNAALENQKKHLEKQSDKAIPSSS